MSMLPQKLYPSDCSGANGGLQGHPTTPSPQPLMNYPYGTVNGGGCAQFGSPPCMSPSMNTYTTMGSPSGQYMGGQGAPGGGVYNNGLSGMNSGSCESLNVNGGGPSPGRNPSSFRESSVIANGGGSVNSAAAAASVASLKTYRRSYTHAKPPYSYISLITMAIQVKVTFIEIFMVG